MTEDLKKWHSTCGIYCKRCPGVKSLGCKGYRMQEGQILKFPMCKTYECVTNRGYVFCYECTDFPYEMLQLIVNFEISTPHKYSIEYLSF